jgi:hypothetical protein
MANSIFACDFGQSTATFNANTTTYSGVGCGILFGNTEAPVQITWRDAGTFSNLYVNVTTNANTGNSVFTYRTGGGNGNEIITLTSGQAGEFFDNVHNDTVASGNQIDFQIAISNSGGALVASALGNIFTSSTPTVCVNKLVSCLAQTDTSVTTTYYNAYSGNFKLTSNTTEAPAQFTNETNANLRNMYAYISANTASVATISSRVGGSAGNMLISISSGATGVMEDTSDTDGVVAGNLVDFSVNSTVTTTFTITQVAADFITSNNTTHYLAASVTGAAFNASTTHYTSIAGRVLGNATETQNSCQTGTTFTSSLLEAYQSAANTVTGSSTLRFRVAAGNGNQVITFAGSSSAGFYQDSSNSDSVSPSTEIDYAIVTGAGGTSLTLSNIGFLASLPVGGLGVGSLMLVGVGI